MSGVFKNLDASDIRLTPFKAYRRSTVYTTYSAAINLKVPDGKEDIYNEPYYANEFIVNTTNDRSVNTIWYGTDAQFYRFYYTNPKAALGDTTNPKNQPRFLSNKALVISIPQTEYGERIEPTTFEMVVNGVTFVDDIHGNLRTQASLAYQVSASNVVFNLKPSIYTWQFGKTITEFTQAVSDESPAEVSLFNAQVTASAFETELKLDNTTYPNSSSIRIDPVMSEWYNFQDRDYTITLNYSGSGNCILLQKKQLYENQGTDLEGRPKRALVYRYPYRLSLDNAKRLVFEKSDGGTTLKVTSSAPIAPGPIVLTRSQSLFTLAYHTASGTGDSGTDIKAITFTDTFRSASRDGFCINNASIYVGADENGFSGSNGVFGNIAFLKQSVDTATVNTGLIYLLSGSAQSGGRNNIYQTVGNVFRRQGFVVVTDKKVVESIEAYGIDSLKYRGTTTINEVEVSCTVTPGELQFTNNPSAHAYDPVAESYVLADFATGSQFKPYITRIGLYDDRNRLLVVGTVTQPIQLPQNVDTTFIIKYDV